MKSRAKIELSRDYDTQSITIQLGGKQSTYSFGFLLESSDFSFSIYYSIVDKIRNSESELP